MSHNSFTTYPSLPLATLPVIESIDISENQIGPWPSCQFDLPKLKRLNILHNPLQGIPWTLFPGAPSLAGGKGGLEFDLARIMQPDPAIAIRGCAVVMEYMSKIWPCFASRALDIRGMNLTSIPAEVWKFSFLSIIRAADNRLDLLPSSLSLLTALRELDVQRNCIHALPVCIVAMTQLVRLDWNGNPLYFPPTVVMYKGLPFVKMWMQRLVTSATSGLSGSIGSGVLEFSGLRLRHVMIEGLSQPGRSPCQVQRNHRRSLWYLHHLHHHRSRIHNRSQKQPPSSTHLLPNAWPKAASCCMPHFPPTFQNRASVHFSLQLRPEMASQRVCWLATIVLW